MMKSVSFCLVLFVSVIVLSPCCCLAAETPKDNSVIADSGAKVESGKLPKKPKSQGHFKRDEHGELAAESYLGENPVADENPLKPAGDAQPPGGEGAVPVQMFEGVELPSGTDQPLSVQAPDPLTVLQQGIERTMKDPVMASQMMKLYDPKTEQVSLPAVSSKGSDDKTDQKQADRS